LARAKLLEDRLEAMDEDKTFSGYGNVEIRTPRWTSRWTEENLKK